MAKIWQPQNKKVLLSWVEAIETEASDKLNDWENSFINDIGNKLRTGGTLTEKQESILERIYADKTS